MKSANNDFTELTFVYEENERCHEFRIAMIEQVSLNRFCTKNYLGTLIIEFLSSFPKKNQFFLQIYQFRFNLIGIK